MRLTPNHRAIRLQHLRYAGDIVAILYILLLALAYGAGCAAACSNAQASAIQAQSIALLLGLTVLAPTLILTNRKILRLLPSGHGAGRWPIFHAGTTVLSAALLPLAMEPEADQAAVIALAVAIASLSLLSFATWHLSRRTPDEPAATA